MLPEPIGEESELVVVPSQRPALQRQDSGTDRAGVMELEAMPAMHARGRTVDDPDRTSAVLGLQ